MKRIFIISLLLPLIFVGCGKKTEEEIAVELQGISLNKKSLSMDIGETARLMVVYNPEEAEKFAPAVTWESSVPGVATVKDGKVTAKQKGKTTITAYCGKYYADCEVEVEVPKINPDPTPDPQINFVVTPTTIETPASGGEYTVTVTSDTPWKAECEKSWATISESAGEGDASITVKVEPTEVEEETAQRIVFSAGRGKYYVVIKRKVKINKITLDQTSIDVPVSGGTFTVKVTSENESWDATCADNNVTITKSGHTATIKVAATTNTIYSEATSQTAKVTFTDGELKATLDLVKECPYAYLDGTDTYFKQKNMFSNTYNLKLKTNIPWSLSLTYDTQSGDWPGNKYEYSVTDFVTVSPQSGSGDKTLTVVVTPRYPKQDCPFAYGRAHLYVSGTGKWADTEKRQLAVFEFEY